MSRLVFPDLLSSSQDTTTTTSSPSIEPNNNSYAFHSEIPESFEQPVNILLCTLLALHLVAFVTVLLVQRPWEACAEYSAAKACHRESVRSSRRSNRKGVDRRRHHSMVTADRQL